MVVDAFYGVYHVFLFARAAYRVNDDVVVVCQFWDEECEFDFCRIYQRVAVFYVGFPVKLRQVERHLHLLCCVRDAFDVRAARSFAVNFNGG